MVLRVLGKFAGGMAIVAATVGAGAGLALLPIAQGTAICRRWITVNDTTDGTPVPSANCLITPTGG